MGRKNKRTIFSEILKEINGIAVKKIIDTNDGNKYSKIYIVEDLMKTYFFMQLNQDSGLRDSKSKFDSSRKLQKKFKMHSVSQLSRMNSTKSVDIFRSLFLYVLGKHQSISIEQRAQAP